MLTSRVGQIYSKHGRDVYQVAGRGRDQNLGLPQDQCSNLIYGMRKAGVMGANGK